MPLTESEKTERSQYLETQLKITECSRQKPYVFISYASDNWRQVFKNAVVPLQKQYGLRVYADKAFDKVNDRWIVPMLRNVRGADAMLVFISQSYIESYACFLELLTAVNNRKQLVFVSLEDNLHLGDTANQPNIERGVKSEILNQGENILANTSNTSNDLMRAMRSAYTSLSTLLLQDALSKYDISDAFISFFRDASVNKKTIQDLGALKDTIESVSFNVFDTQPASASGQGGADSATPGQSNIDSDAVDMDEDSCEDETVVLSALQSVETVKPYLIRSSNHEQIPVDKAVFHIGKAIRHVDYCISGNPTVSRVHADIINKNGRFYIVDNHSTNHTYVNGEMIPSGTEVPLSHGAKLLLSNEKFEFMLHTESHVE